MRRPWLFLFQYREMNFGGSLHRNPRCCALLCVVVARTNCLFDGGVQWRANNTVHQIITNVIVSCMVLCCCCLCFTFALFFHFARTTGSSAVHFSDRSGTEMRGKRILLGDAPKLDLLPQHPFLQTMTRSRRRKAHGNRTRRDTVL